MPSITLTFIRDSSSDIKSSYTRDASNDTTTTSVVGEVDVGSTVNYSVEGMGETLYAWDYEGDDGEPQTIYTKSPLPAVGSYPCDENGNDYVDYGDLGTSRLVFVDPTIDASTETMITITTATER